MGTSDNAPGHRTRIFFFLIFFAAGLWALFLLSQGYLVEFCLVIAFLAVANPVVAFYDIKRGESSRSLFVFYVVVLVGMFWATFLLVMGIQLWLSLLLYIVSIGVPSLLHVLKIDSETGKKPGDD